ncbi:glycine hydroxymethyltransferase [Brevibacterium sanguinis]|uniref:Glycine hydroxymethyltransferase n=2 Tax=Brevibacterium TaxID=1696 RepID=A0A366IL89_9MICO|nr:MULTISPECIES: beta-eliminating lyase-related protein [Brevibacterium]RBP66951.1 glycine hydroxymethyltransferase [Brevibacterium sanguinis]RBP73476.1 glycine hydroxymethyltransferase [Brevibacterium celere]
MFQSPQAWVPAESRARIEEIARTHLGEGDPTAGDHGPETSAATPMAAVVDRIEDLVAASDRLHDEETFNLNPASNVLNPRAAALLSSGTGSRTSLGYPGDKYEMGLEHIEQIEVITAELAARLFHASFAEVRVPSGAMANLYAFMATCAPGDTIIASPATIGGHVTHHAAGAAGLYGLRTVDAPVDVAAYSYDLDALAALAREVRPRLITMGGSLNLFEHPVAKVREIADEVGAHLLFDAAHVCGMIAGKQWANPLDEGAHLMSMSTYKSLGGPTHGLLLSNDAALSERIDAIAFPGLTANFDVSAVAALGVTLADWIETGEDYAARMRACAAVLARSLAEAGVQPFECERGFTDSHQFGLLAAPFGGGTTAARVLERAGFLTSGIGLPVPEIPGDQNGIRIGTPEIVRRGMEVADMPRLASLIARALTAGGDSGAKSAGDAEAGVAGTAGTPAEATLDEIAAEVSAWRREFTEVRFTA